MRRYLVVANQTLGTDQLRQELLLRAETEPASFFIVMPAAPVDRTKERLGRLREAVMELRNVGCPAEGELAQPDPVKAVHRRLRLQEFDEIIVSTLPRRISRWLHMDLPSRLERSIPLPITTLIGKDD